MIEILIILIYIAIAIIVGATFWSSYRAIKIAGKKSGMSNGINIRRICIAVRLAISLILLLSFVLASAEPIHTNTQQYSDIFWLRTSNMLVFTGGMAIIIATVVTVYSFYLNIQCNAKIIK